MTQAVVSRKPALRLLRFLQLRGPCSLAPEGAFATLRGEGEACLRVPEELVLACVGSGLAVLRDGVVSLTAAGERHLRRGLSGEPVPAATGMRATPASDGGPAVNEAESPLARLFLRKDSNGKAWLDADQFEAGERLRRDFERGGLQPRISANWTASVGGRGRGAGAASELSDFALDCRRRVNAAIEALEPSLAGVALDICCFLKGLEQVERERRWPPRSAKLMLRTALSVLADHYGLRAGRAQARMRHWGEADYRPSLPAREGLPAPPA